MNVVLERLDAIIVYACGKDDKLRSSDLPPLVSHLLNLYAKSALAKHDWRRQVPTQPNLALLYDDATLLVDARARRCVCSGASALPMC